MGIAFASVAAMVPIASSGVSEAVFMGVKKPGARPGFLLLGLLPDYFLLRRAEAFFAGAFFAVSFSSSEFSVSPSDFSAACSFTSR